MTSVAAESPEESWAATTDLGPATPAQVERALEAARMDAAAAALSPELQAAVARANAVMNMMSVYRGVLLQPDAPPALVLHAVEEIDGAWEALQGHGVEEWNRVVFMCAVDDAAQKGGGADAVLGALSPELAGKLGAHRSDLDVLVRAWTKTSPGRFANGEPGGKFALCAALWKAATGVETKDHVWKTLWFKVAAPRQEKTRNR